MLPVHNKKSFNPPDLGNFIDVSRYGNLKFSDDHKPSLGNPYVMTIYKGKDGTREDVIKKYAIKLAKDLKRPGFAEWLLQVSKDKKGLLCYCSPELCHGQVISAVIFSLNNQKDPTVILQKFQKDPARTVEELSAYFQKQENLVLSSTKTSLKP